LAEIERERKMDAKKNTETERKLCVALDLDEVLGDFLGTWTAWLRKNESKRYGSLYPADFRSFRFEMILECSLKEVADYMERFVQDSQYEIPPLPDAQQTLKELALTGLYHFVVVTARHSSLAGLTRDWLHRHYPGVFAELICTNAHAFTGPKRTKKEICEEIGAQVFVDDSIIHTEACQSTHRTTLLFDRNQQYRWNHLAGVSYDTFLVVLPSTIHRVHSWSEIQTYLQARCKQFHAFWSHFQPMVVTHLSPFLIGFVHS
jgi:5'(3')-deoxyribonucleotidase